MAALIWFVLALTALAITWLGADLDGLLAAALAALGLSLLSAALPTLALPWQLLLFAGATTALLLALRRWSQRRAPAIPAAGSSEQARVISGFEAGRSGGRVRWRGQSWAAVNLETTTPLPQGRSVLVMGRDGNRLQILASDHDPCPEDTDRSSSQDLGFEP